jgi:ABC-type transport system involved in cytochrome bd biosynthesis fused ATPase/permease subunit
MDVKSHVNLLLKEYNLKPLYYKFISFAIFASLIKETFYWTLIYFSVKLDSKEHIKKVAALLLGILLLNIPLERQANKHRIELIRRLKNANNMYYLNKLKNTAKKDLMNLDLVLFLNTVQTLNTHIQEYIINRKLLGDIPITFVSVVIIIVSRSLGNKNNKGKIMLVMLLIIFFILIVYLNEQEIKREIVVVEETMDYDNRIRDYIVNSKTFLMNNNFNQLYAKNNIEEFNRLFSKMENMENTLLMTNNFSLFIVFSIIISYFLNEITPTNILRYFLIVYDIDTISKKVREFYKNKMSYDKMGIKIKALNDLINEDNIAYDKSAKKITKIHIKALVNDKPALKLEKPILLNSGEHMLIDGVSGSGKTSLMYLLKGVIKVNYYEIDPPLETIHSRCFITLPNHRDLFSAKLYDILSNFDYNPNVELINSTLKIVNLEKYLKSDNLNPFINVQSLSAGEFTRVMIARLIYQIKISNAYDVLLFDEIDMNLNNELSVEICSTLRKIFSDKIIMYITHNDEVKKLFDKKVFVKNGIISDGDDESKTRK